jgi:hypothetical protein
MASPWNVDASRVRPCGVARKILHEGNAARRATPRGSVSRCRSGMVDFDPVAHLDVSLQASVSVCKSPCDPMHRFGSFGALIGLLRRGQCA